MREPQHERETARRIAAVAEFLERKQAISARDCIYLAEKHGPALTAAVQRYRDLADRLEKAGR